MKWPSDYFNVQRNVTPDSEWPGPCEDSFCYASCEVAACRWERRLGPTPHKHNIVLAKMKREERRAASKLLNRKEN